MTTKIKIPNDADLPAALAKLMGWEEHEIMHKVFTDRNGKRWSCLGMVGFVPLTDRNHSRLAVEECVRLGLKWEYHANLAVACGYCPPSDKHNWDGQVPFNCLLAKPCEESRAACLTLAEYHQTKEKP